jgi:transposase-like protein
MPLGIHQNFESSLISKSGLVLGDFPEHCPKLNCLASKKFIIRSGFSEPIACLLSKRRQRFKCTQCGFRFAENHLKLHFRLKHPDPALNSNIFFLFIHGLSIRKLSRRLGISCGSSQIRLKRMSQQALRFQFDILQHIQLNEIICYDGLENFAKSQFEPNYINQAVGYNSLFIYDFNTAILNRKGRTSDRQKLKRDQLNHLYGRFNPQAIRIATQDLFKRLWELKTQAVSIKTTPTAHTKEPLIIYSDQHFQYKRAVKQDLKGLPIRLETISSKATRNFQNILFAVNHVDLLIRQGLAAFSRETISFSKTHGMMCQKYALFMIYKNYMTTQFTKKHVRRPKAHLESPAQSLKITNKILNFKDIFEWRSQKEDTKSWNHDWQAFWSGNIPEKYQRIKRT